MPIKDLAKATDDALLEDMMLWLRIGRNEDGLKGDERTYFRKLAEEIKKRNIFPRRKL